MRRLWSKKGFLALCALGVWITIIATRTNGFVELASDPPRAFAIFGSAISMTVFGVMLGQIFDEPRDPDA